MLWLLARQRTRCDAHMQGMHVGYLQSSTADCIGGHLRVLWPAHVCLKLLRRCYGFRRGMRCRMLMTNQQNPFSPSRSGCMDADAAVVEQNCRSSAIQQRHACIAALLKALTTLHTTASAISVRAARDEYSLFFAGAQRCMLVFHLLQGEHDEQC